MTMSLASFTPTSSSITTSPTSSPYRDANSCPSSTSTTFTRSRAVVGLCGAVEGREPGGESEVCSSSRGDDMAYERKRVTTDWDDVQRKYGNRKWLEEEDSEEDEDVPEVKDVLASKVRIAIHTARGGANFNEIVIRRVARM